MIPTNTTRSLRNIGGTGTAVILFILLLVSFAVAYFPAWKNLASSWYHNDQYSHGFFILPVCIFVLWRKKEILQKIHIRSSSWGLLLIILSLLVYVFAHYAEIATVISLSIIPLFAGMIIYFYGFGMLKEVVFPLFLLFFMIPVPSQIYSSLTIPLQLLVSESSVFIGSLLSMPIYREGNVIHLPEQTLQVVQACSGLRSLVSLLTLSAVLGYFTLQSNILRSALFISGIPIAISVNIIRVLLMIFAFNYFNLDLTKGAGHTLFGMSIFVLALIFVLGVRGLLANWDKSGKG